jgi:hypothetical protein
MDLDDGFAFGRHATNIVADVLLQVRVTGEVESPTYACEFVCPCPSSFHSERSDGGFVHQPDSDIRAHNSRGVRRRDEAVVVQAGQSVPRRRERPALRAGALCQQGRLIRFEGVSGQPHCLGILRHCG